MIDSAQPPENHWRGRLPRHAFWGLGFIASLLLVPAVHARKDRCSGYGTAVVVDVHARALWLCADGVRRAHYPVSLGRGGTGKRVKGDGKTPLGTYALGEPRPSERFGVFIPIFYPTTAQRSQGFTGGEIGIHGPLRHLDWAGSSANTYVDWTEGCIALGTIDEAMKVATFVREHSPSIFIR